MQGLELARRFYFEAVQPILQRRFPDVEHAAARIGHGSEIVGFDDERSTDHHWGPRTQLFLPDLHRAAEIRSVLADELPTTFAGYPTHFGPTEEDGVVRMTEIGAGPVEHGVETLVLREFLREELGVDPLEGFGAADWLVTPAQRLLEITAGEVFADPKRELTRVREILRWYPHDVWLHVMAGHWRRVAQLEHLLGRTGSRGDELGSRLIGASLVRDLMTLSLLQERRYPPYAKWLGSAYAELGRPEANALGRALAEPDWHAREDALVEAYESVARRHNELEVTEPVEPTVRNFWGRPFRVLFADRFVDALQAAISDPVVRAVDHPAGAVDSVSDNTDVLAYATVFRRLKDLYDRS